MPDDRTTRFLDALDETLRAIPIYTTPKTPREADWSVVVSSEPVNLAWLQLDREQYSGASDIMSAVAGLCSKSSELALSARKLYALASIACGDNERAATLMGIPLEHLPKHSPALTLVPETPSSQPMITAEPSSEIEPNTSDQAEPVAQPSRLDLLAHLLDEDDDPAHLTSEPTAAELRELQDILGRLVRLPDEEDDPGRELTAEYPADSEPAIEPAELHTAMADGEPSPERAMMASAEPAELRVAMVASAQVPENGSVLAESDATNSPSRSSAKHAKPATVKPAIEVIDFRPWVASIPGVARWPEVIATASSEPVPDPITVINAISAVTAPDRPTAVIEPESDEPTRVFFRPLPLPPPPDKASAEPVIDSASDDPPVSRIPHWQSAMMASAALGVTIFAGLAIVAVVLLSQETATPEQQTVISAPTQPRSRARPVLTTPAEPSAEHTEAVASAPDLEEQGERLANSEPESEPTAIGETETETAKSRRPTRKAKRRHADRQPAKRPSLALVPIMPKSPLRLHVQMGTAVEIQPADGREAFTVSVSRSPNLSTSRVAPVPAKGRRKAPKPGRFMPRLPIQNQAHQIQWYDEHGTASMEVAVK